GSGVVDFGTVTGGWTSNGPVVFSNGSSMTGGLFAPSVVLAKSSGNKTSNFTGGISGNSVTLSPSGFTDNATGGLPPDTSAQISGPLLVAASRTNGVSSVRLQGAPLHPVSLTVTGTTTIGQLGGQAELDQNPYSSFSTQDLIVGSGSD